MKTIYLIRGVLCRFYMRFELIFKSLIKFAAYFFIFRIIAGWNGFSGEGILNATSVHMMMALVCVLLPSRFVAMFACFIIVYNVYIVSFWGAAMIALLLAVLYIMIARFTPDEAFLLILMPIAMKYDLFLTIPLFGGLYMGVFSIIPMIGGILFWGILRIIPAFMQFSVEAIDELPAAFTEMSNYIANQLLKNENLIFLMILCFGVTMIVWLLNKMSLKHIRYVSLTFGTIIGLFCLLVGRSLHMIDLNMVAVLWAPIISFVVLCVIEFFHMVLNYQMAQQLAFADNEYFYYVKAIPKILGKRKNQAEVKTITNTQQIPETVPEERVPARPAVQENEPAPIVWRQDAKKKPVTQNTAEFDLFSSAKSQPSKAQAAKQQAPNELFQDFTDTPDEEEIAAAQNTEKEAAVAAPIKAEKKAEKKVEKKADKKAGRNAEKPEKTEKAEKKSLFAAFKKNTDVPAASKKEEQEPLPTEIPETEKTPGESPVSFADNNDFAEELSFDQVNTEWEDAEEIDDLDNGLSMDFFEEEDGFGNAGDDSESESAVSQQKIDELRERTGWSDETIKGFLAGLDEENKF